MLPGKRDFYRCCKARRSASQCKMSEIPIEIIQILDWFKSEMGPKLERLTPNEWELRAMYKWVEHNSEQEAAC